MNHFLNILIAKFKLYSTLEFGGNTVPKYILALAILLIAFLVYKLICNSILKQIEKLTERTNLKWDDVFTKLLKRNTALFSWAAALYTAFLFLKTNPTLHKVINAAFAIIIGIIVIRISQGLISYWFQIKYFISDDIDVAKKSVMKNVLLLIKVILWSCVGLFILDNLGFDITTMVAGLGIGGMAIALASQNILGDVFSYFTIFFDKPFFVGDFIVVGDLMGTVEHIGIKTTRIKSIQGEQLVFGNADLISSRIKNYKQMQQRRICNTIGVIYETQKDKLQKIPDIIKDIITEQKNANFDRAHFKNFGDFSLDFEYVYYVTSSEYVVFMDTQQEINLKLFEAFANEGIEFAYPTQVIYTNSNN